MRKIGHRGACGHAPENTRASFAKALEFGVDGVEFDIQLSHDDEPMVIHDATLDRTTNGRGKVRDSSYAQLQLLDAGGGERIPHLNDVFAVIDKKCDLMIELKTDAVEAVEKIIREQVASGWHYAQLWAFAFDHALLTKMHKLNSRVQICASFEQYPTDLARTKQDTGATAIGPCLDIVDAALMQDASALSLQIITWTVNSPAAIKRAKTLGIDGIISDFPERL